MKLATLLGYVRDGLIAVALLLLLALSAGAFAFPWIELPPTFGRTIERYSPVRDGSSSLTVEYDANNAPIRWSGANTAILKSARALASDLQQGTREEMLKIAGKSGANMSSDEDTLAGLSGIQILETHRRDLDGTGRPRETVFITMRDARGEFLVSLFFPANNSELVYDPPALLFPANIDPRSQWTSEGKAGAGTYLLTGQVLQTGSFSSALGKFDDCLLVASHVTNDLNGTTTESFGRDWYCAGIGLVESQTVNSTGGLISRSVTYASDEFHSVEPTPLPSLKPIQTPEPIDVAVDSSWALYRLGRLGRGVSATEGVISPVWIPGDPPLLLAAGYDSDLVAYDASQLGLSQVWSFHTGGTVYGPPAFDPARGRIYFGATDKYLYAVDRRGVYLWSFLTQDSVASRPVVIGDIVVFGSEDRYVYGLDADTGRERWRFETGGPVVSSPAIAAGTVVIGSDDGSIYGLHPETGQIRWTFDAADGVEAPVTAAEGTVYIASRDGKVYALDASTGIEIWSTRPTSILRTAPVVGAGRVFVVNDSSRLTIHDAKTGKRLWQSTDAHYAGAPLLIGETLIVSGNDGNVYRFGIDGQKLGQWSLAEQTNVADSSAYFALGPSSGGNAVWLVDRRAGLWRLGAPISSAPLVPLKLSWVDMVGNPPYALYPIANTLIGYRDHAIAVDGGFNVYQVNPASGSTVRLGSIAPETGALKIEPAISGDTMLTIVGDTLYATQLPDMKPLWQIRGDGYSMRPPTVTENTVVWLAAPSDMQVGNGKGTVYAIDLSTGSVRWTSPISLFSAVGGAVVHDHTVYLSTPPVALDLETGQVRWRATLLGSGLGAPGLDRSGSTLFVAAGVGDSGVLAAISTADGQVRWRAETTAGVLNPIDSIWTSENTLVYPVLGGKIIGFDANSGKELWTYSPPVRQLGNITVDRGLIWLTLENSQVLALDAATGRMVAQFTDLELNLSGVGFTQRPTIVGDRILVPIGAAILGLDAGKANRR